MAYGAVINGQAVGNWDGFILDSTISGHGSEVFVPKLRSYKIDDVKIVLQELLGNTGEEKIPVRQGEKFHETLINIDETRTALESESKYIILQKKLSDQEINEAIPYIIEVVNNGLREDVLNMLLLSFAETHDLNLNPAAVRRVLVGTQ